MGSSIRCFQPQTEHTWLRGLLVAAWLVTTSSGLATEQASFQGLGDLAGGYFSSVATGISADGSTAVGRGASSASEAFRWTSEEGMVGLGSLLGYDSSQAYAVSGDGSVVVGFGWITGQGMSEAFRWTEPEGMVGLGHLSDGAVHSRSWGVSADGLVVVGMSSSSSGTQAFRWTEETGMVGLGYLVASLSYALDVSADGSVVVGLGKGAYGVEAFRWTSGGMVGLGYFSNVANGVSDNGSVVVGDSNSASGQEAFRWTQETGIVGLGDLPGGFFASAALDVSADGSVIVGRCIATAMGTDAFIWTATDGMVHLQDLLVNTYGLNLGGWRLSEATGVSADGMTIVGTGDNPVGQSEAWIVRLPGHISAVAWRSVRTHHSGVGVDVDLAIPLDPGRTGTEPDGPSAETRNGGIQRIEVDFDLPVRLAPEATIGIEDATTGTVYPATSAELVNGDKMLAITFDPGVLPTEACYVLDLAGTVEAFPGVSLGDDTDCMVRSLVGDVNVDGSTNNTDKSWVASLNGHPAWPDYIRFDVNLDGQINNTDKSLVGSLNGHGVTCP